jgi:hypothetical protein
MSGKDSEEKREREKERDKERENESIDKYVHSNKKHSQSNTGNISRLIVQGQQGVNLIVLRVPEINCA